MPINFQLLQPIQPKQGVIAQGSPPPSGGSGDSGGGLGGLISGLGGLISGMSGAFNGASAGASDSTAPQANNMPIQTNMKPPVTTNSNNFGNSQAQYFNTPSNYQQAQQNNPLPSNLTGNSIQRTNQPGSQSIYNTASQFKGQGPQNATLVNFLHKSNPSLDPSTTPWCAGFANGVMAANGIQGTGSLAAKSFLNFGTPTKTPGQGDIVVFNDLTGNNDPAHGHVGFVDHIDQDRGMVYTLGGNESGQVMIKPYPMSSVAGFRTPPSGQQVQQFAQQNNIKSPQQLSQVPQLINSNPQLLNSFNKNSNNPQNPDAATSQQNNLQPITTPSLSKPAFSNVANNSQNPSLLQQPKFGGISGDFKTQNIPAFTQQQNNSPTVQQINNITSNSSITPTQQNSISSPQQSSGLPQGITDKHGNMSFPMPQATGSLSDQTSGLLRHYEEFTPRAAWDVNAYRAGFGSDTTTLANGQVVRVHPGMTVNQADAERDLSRRAQEFQNTAAHQVGDQWNNLPDNVKAGLTSVSYNYGHLPHDVVNAAKTGDPNAIAQAIRNHANDNKGVNRDRRNGEANFILQNNQQNNSTTKVRTTLNDVEPLIPGYERIPQNIPNNQQQVPANNQVGFPNTPTSKVAYYDTNKYGQYHSPLDQYFNN